MLNILDVEVIKNELILNAGKQDWKRPQSELKKKVELEFKDKIKNIIEQSKIIALTLKDEKENFLQYPEIIAEIFKLLDKTTITKLNFDFISAATFSNNFASKIQGLKAICQNLPNNIRRLKIGEYHFSLSVRNEIMDFYTIFLNLTKEKIHLTQVILPGAGYIDNYRTLAFRSEYEEKVSQCRQAKEEVENQCEFNQILLLLMKGKWTSNDIEYLNNNLLALIDYKTFDGHYLQWDLPAIIYLSDLKSELSKNCQQKIEELFERLVKQNLQENVNLNAKEINITAKCLDVLSTRPTESHLFSLFSIQNKTTAIETYYSKFFDKLMKLYQDNQQEIRDAVIDVCHETIILNKNNTIIKDLIEQVLKISHAKDKKNILIGMFPALLEECEIDSFLKIPNTDAADKLFAIVKEEQKYIPKI